MYLYNEPIEITSSYITDQGSGRYTADLTVSPFFVPSNMSFAHIRLEVYGSRSREIYVSFYGSKPTGSMPVGYESCDVLAPNTGNGIIEFWTDLSTYEEVPGGTMFKLHLFGYFLGTEGTVIDLDLTPDQTTAPANTPLMNDTWVTIDPEGAQGVPANCTFAVIEIRDTGCNWYNDCVGSNFSLRKNGTTAVVDLSGGGYLLNRPYCGGSWAVVPCTSAGVFDLYGCYNHDYNDRNHYADALRQVLVLGYLTSGTQNANPSTTDKEEDIFTGAFEARVSNGSNGACAIAVIHPTAYSGGEQVTWRRYGSSFVGTYAVGQIFPMYALLPIGTDNKWEIKGYADTYDPQGPSGEQYHAYSWGWTDASVGPSNVKTIQGLVKASVKLMQGVSMAQVKNYGGVT